MRDNKPGQKGTYSDRRLPVADRYVVPHSRRGMLWIGFAAVALLLATVLVDRFLRRGGLLSNGPLAASHAGFEDDCASCHAGAAREVTDEKCSVCHEKYGDDLGVYSFGAHYVYRSDDFRRLVPSERERPCHACHVEHEGRDAAIAKVADAQCLTCHDFGSFNDRHPQFSFATDDIADDESLSFSHGHHVRELMKTEGLEDLERACLYCHNAQADGRGFDAIDFDRHCDACHLTATTATPALPVQQAGDTRSGVDTLEAIVARRGPETRWALYSNPNEFRRRGAAVSKAPVHHRDPWILLNLRSLRRRLYPDAGLADLLTTTPDVPASDSRRLYREAIDTLEDRALGLRGRPETEVQEELTRIEEILERLRREIDEPFATLDDTKFLLAFDTTDPGLGTGEVEEIEALVADLTEPCRQCHAVRNATISRVRAGQDVLRRAEFDHRAHILQRRCLDCHAEIPIAELARTTGEIDPAVDNAGIENLPRIEVCRECHTARLGTNECVTCHLFHPDKDRRANLLLYLEPR